MKRISIILILTVFLSGCSSTQSVSYEFKNSYEGIVQKDGYMTNFEYASTDRCTYYFEDNTYSDEEKNKFINNLEKIFDYIIKDMKATIDLPINIYVANKLFVQGKYKSVFLNDINAKNIHSINAFFQGIVGSTPNYGLGYGLSLYVYEKVFKDTYKPENEIAKVSEYLLDVKNLDILDLAIPVFEEVYFTKEDNTYAYDIAFYLIKDIIKQKGVGYAFELYNKSKDLDISFEKEYEIVANDWLRKIGAQASYKATNVPLRYEKNIGRNIKTYPYIIQSPSTESYIELGFTLTNDVDIFSMDYGYIKYFFELFEKDVKSLKETDIFSKYLETPEEKPICQFREKISNIKLGGGIVHNYNEQITIEYRDPLYAGVHEYAHYLAIKSNKPRAGWLEEGFAVYCEHYLADRGVYRLMYESWGDFNNIYSDLPDNVNSIKQLYEKLVNDKPPFKKNEINLYAWNESKALDAILDKKEYTTLREIRFGIVGDISEGLDLTYPESGSLVNYLIETYGEEKLCELLKNYDRLYDIYGKTFKELQDEWYLALKAKFE